MRLQEKDLFLERVSVHLTHFCSNRALLAPEYPQTYAGWCSLHLRAAELTEGMDLMHIERGSIGLLLQSKYLLCIAGVIHKASWPELRKMSELREENSILWFPVRDTRFIAVYCGDWEKDPIGLVVPQYEREPLRATHELTGVNPLANYMENSYPKEYSALLGWEG